SDYDLIVIGGGPAGLAAATAAYDQGLHDILIIERDRFLGGILNQCIHTGFGLQEFREELTGPEYAQRFVDRTLQDGIPFLLDTMVLALRSDRTVVAISPELGRLELHARAVVLSMGCRERTRAAIMVPGTRPAGVMTAGTAQRYMNVEGYLPGRNIVILGSGDIGLIMARRFTLEGARVNAVLEIMPYSTGLTRNVVQCLDDYNIPLLLSHTVTSVHGGKRVTGVSIAQVDEHRCPVPGTEREIPCDTLITSVGLVPENELSKTAGVQLDAITGGALVNQRLQTSVEGVFACGNVLQVHDLVDNVSEESQRAGRSAALYVQGKLPRTVRRMRLVPAPGIRYIVPQYIDVTEQPESVKLFMRPTDVFKGASIELWTDKQKAPLARFHRTRLTPGEMVVLTVQGSVFAAAETDVMVEVEVL
ncbi:MAG TPA: FAD/NAD(P)-binding oxidoreductase, partial [Clostridia bacterium]|nr:FAD/NAD(P)-binding oxidoreductase [Clostridia bacterium]